MRKFIFFILFAIMLNSAFSQFITTKNAHISFYSKAPLEDIEAHNYNVACVFDTVNNQIAFVARIRDFSFKKKLMQKHFCEKYMEEEDFPISTFNGDIKILNKNSKSDYVEVKGYLEIHGEKKEIIVNGNILEDENGISMISEFKIDLDDFKVKIPKVVKDNISKFIDIKVSVNLKK